MMNDPMPDPADRKTELAGATTPDLLRRLEELGIQLKGLTVCGSHGNWMKDGSFRPTKLYRRDYREIQRELNRRHETVDDY